MHPRSNMLWHNVQATAGTVPCNTTYVSGVSPEVPEQEPNTRVR